MNRRVLLAMAVATIVFSTNTAFAGSPKTQYVRVKNTGVPTLKVVAANGALNETLPTRSLSQNAVTQFVLKKGAGFLSVSSVAEGSTPSVLEYNFPKSTYVYLQAKEVEGTVTPSFAPPGTRF